MMNVFHKIFMLLAALLLLTACEEDTLPGGNPPGADGQLVFSLQTLRGEIGEESLTRGMDTDPPLSRVHYVVLNGDGNIISPYWQSLAPDFSSLTINGLPAGNYSIAVYATTSADAEAVKPVVSEGQLLLTNPSEVAPLNADYLFGRIDFTVDNTHNSRAIPVPLRRCVGRVEVKVNPTLPYTNYLIKKVEVSLDSSDGLYLSRNDRTENAFAGNGTISQLDVTANRGFYSLPSKRPLSGTVTVLSLRDDGAQVSERFNFSDVEIEEGKITTIQVDWKATTGNKGLFRVTEADFNAQNLRTMFLDDEPREVFYNPAHRSFRTDKPLQVKVNNEGRLQLNSYSPMTVKNVIVWCRFKRHSTEFYKFAQYDVVPGFSESDMYIPLTGRSLTYTSKDGRNVLIPAQPNLSEEDCEFRIESDDPYMVKISSIVHAIDISFSPFSANDNHPYWRHMTPELCRQASVLMVNMSYMFSSQEFENRVRNWKGNPFIDDQGNPISAETVIRRTRNVTLLKMGTVVGVGGLGGNSTFGLADYCYRGQYWDTDDKYSYAKMAIYHEFGHCMGYGHESSMTYGDAWTILCQELGYDLGASDQLPVSNSSWQ